MLVSNGRRIFTRGEIILVRYQVVRAFTEQDMVVARPLPVGSWRGDPLLTLAITLPIAAIEDVVPPGGATAG